jgi:ABC-2 type transport system ATP-binding protein
VISKGRIVAEGTPEDLKRLVAGGTVVEIETFGVPAETVVRVGQVGGVSSVTVEERDQAQVIVVRTGDGTPPTQGLLAELGDVQVGRVSVREPTLEDAYVALVEEEE